VAALTDPDVEAVGRRLAPIPPLKRAAARSTGMARGEGVGLGAVRIPHMRRGRPIQQVGSFDPAGDETMALISGQSCS
jgi:hypothetical protein